MFWVTGTQKIASQPVHEQCLNFFIQLNGLRIVSTRDEGVVGTDNSEVRKDIFRTGDSSSIGNWNDCLIVRYQSLWGIYK
jgi:hypothetical protein